MDRSRTVKSCIVTYSKYVMLNIQGSLGMITGSYFVVTDLCAFVLTAEVDDISNMDFFVKCVRLFTSVKLRLQ